MRLFDSALVADLVAAFVAGDRKKTFSDSGSLHGSPSLLVPVEWVRGREVFNHLAASPYCPTPQRLSRAQNSFTSASVQLT
jgi:hypothetical protein